MTNRRLHLRGPTLPFSNLCSCDVSSTWKLKQFRNRNLRIISEDAMTKLGNSFFSIRNKIWISYIAFQFTVSKILVKLPISRTFLSNKRRFHHQRFASSCIFIKKTANVITSKQTPGAPESRSKLIGERFDSHEGDSSCYAIIAPSEGGSKILAGIQRVLRISQ